MNGIVPNGKLLTQKTKIMETNLTLQTTKFEINQLNGQTIDVILNNENVWLTQAQMAELFGTKRQAITKHLKNIFDSGELEKNSVSSILEHTASDGKNYQTLFYNLDAILSIGYRVNSASATQFRKWATQILKSYLVDGYVVNEKILNEKIAELNTQLQALSVLMINKIPVTEKTIMEILMSNQKINN
jgi:hypothetical protein